MTIDIIHSHIGSNDISMCDQFIFTIMQTHTWICSCNYCTNTFVIRSFFPLYLHLLAIVDDRLDGWPVPSLIPSGPPFPQFECALMHAINGIEYRVTNSKCLRIECACFVVAVCMLDWLASLNRLRVINWMYERNHTNAWQLFAIRYCTMCTACICL